MPGYLRNFPDTQAFGKFLFLHFLIIAVTPSSYWSELTFLAILQPKKNNQLAEVKNHNSWAKNCSLFI